MSAHWQHWTGRLWQWVGRRPLLSRTSGEWRHLYLLAGFATIGLFFLPEGLSAFSICPFWNLTGLPCPGCGMTRALSALLHGDLRAAALFHPLSSLMMLALLVLVAAGFSTRLSFFLQSHGRQLRRIVWLSVAVLLVFGLLRLVVVVWEPAWSVGLSAFVR